MCGLPGAGKTTLARELARTGGAVRLSPDEWLGGLRIDLWDEPARETPGDPGVAPCPGILAVGTSVLRESGFRATAELDEKRRVARLIGVAA